MRTEQEAAPVQPAVDYGPEEWELVEIPEEWLPVPMLRVRYTLSCCSFCGCCCTSVSLVLAVVLNKRHGPVV